ncbi:MAG: PrsW family intramembrane metalloprotease [Anaerolineae bacterium]|jgi:RsiW-degrading membrane proteinase PrsW (M82 family)
MLRGWLVVLLVAVGVLLVVCPVQAEDPAPQSDLDLARSYAPVFYFHPHETFRPQSVDVFLAQARLRRSRRLWFDTNVLLKVDVLDLLDLETDERHFLDVWYGREGGSAYANYSAHQAFYEGALSPSAGGPPPTVYAHVTRDELGRVTVQYWAFYFYNDWFNKHEGDWEMVQVMLGHDGQPEWVVLSQHHGGTRRRWSQATVEDITHPVAYVAQGSHANYFVGDEVYPNTQAIGDRQFTVVDRTGRSHRTVPQIILLPDRAALLARPADWPGAGWLPFRGRWGETAAQSDFGGPFGPPEKGEQWERPYAWGMAQPLDVETWYTNRARVELVGAPAVDSNVQLTDQHGQPLGSAETLGSVAILHTPPPQDGIVATIEVPPGTRADLVAAWPDSAAQQVKRYRFEDIDFAETGLARLDVGPGLGVNLQLRCTAAEAGGAPSCLSSARLTEETTREAAWDAPDLIWIGGVLPAHQVGAGLLLSVAASVVPTALYIGALYWLDRYEKEPRLLVTAAFLWGGVPALGLALAAELFFRLPPDLIGSRVLGAARLGLIGPLVRESLKGIAVLYIALRYRHEFDNVLDGIIYGAVVGFGFAMTGNLIGHLSAFALQGFEALKAPVLVEGLLYGLNHAFYTAVFGAGLGFARLATPRWRRWAWPLIGFLLAVTAHALHSLLAWSPLGVDVVNIVTTGAGILLIGLVAGWSLQRQRRSLRSELQPELAAALYRELVAPGGRARARWLALQTEGLRGWWRTRRLHQRCAELAFRKTQLRAQPDQVALNEEIERLRAEIQALVGDVA